MGCPQRLSGERQAVFRGGVVQPVCPAGFAFRYGSDRRGRPQGSGISRLSWRRHSFPLLPCRFAPSGCGSFASETHDVRRLEGICQKSVDTS